VPSAILQVGCCCEEVGQTDCYDAAQCVALCGERYRFTLDFSGLAHEAPGALCEWVWTTLRVTVTLQRSVFWPCMWVAFEEADYLLEAAAEVTYDGVPQGTYTNWRIVGPSCSVECEAGPGSTWRHRLRLGFGIGWSIVEPDPPPCAFTVIAILAYYTKTPPECPDGTYSFLFVVPPSTVPDEIESLFPGSLELVAV